MAQHTMTLVDLALKVYREKSTELPVILSQELEMGFKALLYIANDDPEWLDEARSASGATITQLKAAAIYFFELYAFKDKKDPYDLLGLTPLAPQSEVKTHYRLMMRLFHPDRTSLSLKRARNYATLINQAMDTIQQKTKKELSPQNLRARPSIVLPNDRPHQFTPDSSFTKSLRSIILNYSLFFLVIILGVTLYVMNHQPQTQLQETYVSKEKVDEPLLKEDQNYNDTKNKNNTLINVAPAVEADLAIDPYRQVPQVESLDNKTEALPPINPSINSLKKITNEKIRDVAIPKKNVPEAQPTTEQIITSKLEDQQPQAMEPLLEKPIDKRSTEKIFSLQDMRNLTFGFVEAYNKGNLESLMQLMSDDIKTEAMLNKMELRLAYAKVFANYVKREMILRNLQFVSSSSSIKARTHYQLKSLENNRTEPKIIFGELEIEGTLEHGLPKIITLNNRVLP